MNHQVTIHQRLFDKMVNVYAEQQVSFNVFVKFNKTATEICAMLIEICMDMDVNR